MRLFAALGPGDIVAAHRAQMRGEPILSETSIIFSGQLFAYCRERGIETLALSRNPRSDDLRDGALRIENRPRRFDGRGIRYHVASVRYALYLAWRARRFGADIAIIDSGSAHYFALAVFGLLGIPVAVNFHNTLWPNGFEPQGRGARLIRWLDGAFFRNVAVGAVGCSPECARQVQQLAGYALPFFEYRAQFRSDGFSPLQRDHGINPFRVLFVGRVERSKGALDMALMAERLRAKSHRPIVFEICGDGGALSELKSIVDAKGLGDIVHVRGRLARPELLEVYRRAHAVIVPTRGDFCEGLPLVCAEAVLSGLPLVTSRVSNAIPVLGAAIVEAQPENIDSYVRAILSLADDQKAYARAADACPALAQQFLDRSQSYPAAIDRLIAHAFPKWTALASWDPVFAPIA